MLLEFNNSLDLIQSFNNMLVHEMCDAGLLVSQFDTLYLIADLNKPELTKIGAITIKPTRQIGRIRIVDRIIKCSIQHAFHITGIGYFVMTSDGWWIVTEEGESKRIHAPFKGRLMARSGCLANNGQFYFAQYTVDQKREKAIIMSTQDFKTFHNSWEFPPLTLRHIHAIVKDSRHDTRLWILTGDFDHECCFYYTDDYFSSIKQLPCYGQKTRATDILTTDNGLLWGMDSPNTYSSILTWEGDFTNPPIELAKLPGPAYYMATNKNNHIYIGTTAEPGPATKENSATVWGKTPHTQWQQLISFQSDKLPQYAIIYLPRNPLPENFLVFSTRAVKKHDGKLFIFRDNTHKSQDMVHC